MFTRLTQTIQHNFTADEWGKTIVRVEIFSKKSSPLTYEKRKAVLLKEEMQMAMENGFVWFLILVLEEKFHA